MVILRATRKVLKRVGPASSTGISETALGDWYANRVVIDRRPLLVLVSSKALLPIVMPARGLTSLPANLPGLVRDRLHRLGIPEQLIDAEIASMEPVQVGPTVDRSVLGIMVRFGEELPFYLNRDGWGDGDLAAAERKLAETPCRAGRSWSEVIFPLDATPILLEQSWGLGRGTVR